MYVIMTLSWFKIKNRIFKDLVIKDKEKNLKHPRRKALYPTKELPIVYKGDISTETA